MWVTGKHRKTVFMQKAGQTIYTLWFKEGCWLLFSLRAWLCECMCVIKPFSTNIFQSAVVGYSIHKFNWGLFFRRITFCHRYMFIRNVRVVPMFMPYNYRFFFFIYCGHVFLLFPYVFKLLSSQMRKKQTFFI